MNVIGPAKIVQPGEEVRFRAQVGMIGPRFKYNWKVNQGEIIRGQGTDTIAVTNLKPNSNITASVEVEGIPSGCENKGEDSTGVAAIPPSCPLDEWSNLRPNDVRGRVDSFFSALMNNPDNSGLFVISFTEKEARDASNPRIRLILKHSKFREFDLQRLMFAFVIENSEEPTTKLYRMPPGAMLPCEDCQKIDAMSLN